jgi:hypothetical protein
MQAPNASDLLAVWERAQSKPVIARAVMLLSLASDANEEELTNLSVGRRDGHLLSLRETLFGSKLNCLTACPRCSQQLELVFDANELRAEPEPSSRDALFAQSEKYSVRFRLPNTQDLNAISEINQAEDEQAAIQNLFARCILELKHNGRIQAITRPINLPQELMDAVAEQMEKADPQANVQLNLSCDACGTGWLSTFDIATFLWSEVDAWAQRVLREVFLLASAFGWSEHDILSMSAHRRSLYLNMLDEAT